MIYLQDHEVSTTCKLHKKRKEKKKEKERERKKAKESK